MTTSLLSTITFLPILGILIIYLLGNFKNSTGDIFAKTVALSISLIILCITLCIWVNFDSTVAGYQFVEKRVWFEGLNIYYAMGVDGISILLVLLSAFIIPICIICSWNSIKFKVKEYMMLFLLIETMIIGTFCAQDLLLFFIFFEAVLIPMYFIIGIWGGENRVYAAYKFFLYTLAGSVLLLISVAYIYLETQTTFIPDLNEHLPKYGFEAQKWLWLAFFASFAIKIPMWPVHTWLPDAHVQAPTAGSVILAGVLLKLGGYGFIRFSIPFFPLASVYFADFIFWLSIVAVIYTSLIALMQEDMKKLIAYSSIAHMGFVTAGLFTFTEQGVEGAIFQMISHGIISSALFICVGVLYDRMHTKEIVFYSGLTQRMPKYAFHFMIYMLASVGLPATSGFVGEFLILLAAFETDKLYSALLTTGLILGAAYMLWLYGRVMFGKIKNEKLKKINDLNLVEKISLFPLSIIIIVIGIYPNLLLNDIHSSVNYVLEKFDQNQVNSTNPNIADSNLEVPTLEDEETY